MFLKSIEVQGFKSFANKLIFDFSSGITGIVGPNGSGKSNVADAVRWVLGEQSAKQLRGSSMQDVIFAGTQNRKPQGYAYVAITFDNGDHALPIDYEELTVARRVYRSGESEYLMNGSPCRLRDVHELFYDTGIGKEGYSIIGQGQIDKILSGKPEDRRELFDEAAGIVKFKKRKNVAMKKLDAEQANLVRLSDIIGEMERQVGPLERQSVKAKEYLRLRDELKVLDMKSFHLEHGEQEKKLQEVKEKLSVILSQLKEAEDEAAEIKVQYDTLSDEIQQLDDGLTEDRQKQTECRVSSQAKEGEIRVLEEQIRTDEAGEVRVAARIEMIDSSVSEKEKERAGYIKEKGDLNVLLDRLDDKKTNLEEKLLEDEERIRELEEEIEGRKNDILDTLNDKASIGARNERFDTLLSQNQLRKSEIANQLITIKSEEDALRNAIKGFEESIGNLRTSIQEKESLLKDEEEAAESLQNELRSDRQTQIHRQREYQVVKTRLESLQNMAERYDGYGNSIRRVMELKNQKSGIIGVVADLVETKKEYETAIETALGGSIQNIVTQDEDTAKELIEHLKKNKFGRATFLPLTALKTRSGISRPEALREKGVIGLADSLVTIKGGYTNLAEYLLGRILVVDNIDHAIAIARKYQYSLRIVTLDGELFNAGGSMTGGAFKNSSNLLGRKRELEELMQSLQKNKIGCKAIADDIEEKEKKANAAKASADKLQGELQDARVKLSSQREKLKSLQDKKAETHGEYERIRRESGELSEEAAKLNKEKAELKEENKTLESKSRNSEKEIKKLETKLSHEKELLEKHRKEHGEAALEFSNVSQKDQFALENMRRVADEISRFREEKNALSQEQTQYASHKAEKEASIESTRSAIAELKKQDEELSAEMTRKQALRNEKQEKQRSFFRKREELSEEIGRFQKEQYRLENQQEKWEDASSRLIQYLWEEYEMTPSAVPKPDPSEELSLSAIRKDTEEKRKQIRELGPVNVNAIEEYKEVSERYFFMKGQYEDVKKAEETLLNIIRELDEGMRRQFEEKFKDIRVEFDKVFKELFGGGQGTLELLEGDDILEAGIAIIAQPPGKKLQNMMQLSGGEKALTAISLLFAIQNLKPSPFCLLDEIEAALDDSNVGRYASYLDKLKEKSQFIVITHRRGTMLIADRLYGITMQEKGVSTMVPVDLTDQPE